MKTVISVVSALVLLSLSVASNAALVCDKVLNFDRGYGVKIISDASREVAAMIYKKGEADSPVSLLRCQTPSAAQLPQDDGTPKIGTPGFRGRNDQTVYICRNFDNAPSAEVIVNLSGLDIQVDVIANGALETQLACSAQQ